MSDTEFSASLERIRQTDKPVFSPDNRPDLARMAQDAKAYAERILPTISGEHREDAEPVLANAHSVLSHADVMSRRVGYSLFEEVADAERLLDEIIGDLKDDFGVKDTEVLDNIQQELRTWLNERRLPPGQARRL